MSKHHPAAFINAIAEEGTKDEAIQWLQTTWNDLYEVRALNAELVEALVECEEWFSQGREPQYPCIIKARAVIAKAKQADGGLTDIDNDRAD